MKSTTDIWFASYLILHEVELDTYEKPTPRKVVFKFDLDEDTWQEHKLQFFKSDYGKIRQAQERLKDLLY